MIFSVAFARAAALATVGLAFGLATTVTGSVAQITKTPIATSVQAQPSAPAVITRCLASLHFGDLEVTVNVLNRTTHGLLSYGIQYRYFDRDRALMGQFDQVVTLNEVLTPDDTGSYDESPSFQSSEPIMALAAVTCRLTHATFTGKFAWSYGQRWNGGPLTPISTPVPGGNVP